MCHYLAKCDMFGCQCACSNMSTCDELVCEMAMTWLDCECATAWQCSDLFGCQYKYSNVSTCDELIRATTITWLAFVCVIALS